MRTLQCSILSVRSCPLLSVNRWEIRVKYAGYIERQMRDVEQYRKLQSRPLPLDLDYNEVDSLRTGGTSETERRQAAEFRSGGSYFGRFTWRISLALMIYIRDP